MTYPQQRRTEHWVGFAVSITLVAVFSWLAVSKELPFLWWFAGPFFILVPLTAWRATRPTSVFEREEEKLDAFAVRHPILSSILILASGAASLWTVGGALIRVLAYLTE